MSSSAPETGSASATGVTVTDDALTVHLADGRRVSAPLSWFPRLSHGSPEERSRWRLIGEGEGIHWPDLDEDISVEHLLEGRRSAESRASISKWLDKRARSGWVDTRESDDDSIDVSPGSPFQEHARLLLQLHDLIAADQDESDEGERIRDAMDDSWYRMSEREKDVLGGLSADLYTIGQNRKATDSPACSLAFKEFDAAVQRKKWGTALDIIRENENSLPPSVVAVCRGGSWSQLGVPDAAIRFFQEARRLGDDSPLVDVWRIKCCFQSGRTSDALILAEEFVRGNQQNALRTLLAASVFSTLAETVAEPTQTMHRKRAVALARQGLGLAADSQPSDPVEIKILEDFRFDTHFNLACDLDTLGDLEHARIECEKALSLAPDDLDARVLHDVLFDGKPKMSLNCENNRTRIWERISLCPTEYGASGLIVSSVLAG